MITELCQELHNWFDRERHTGTFTIENGNITADFLAEGQYFRIVGSVFNDGVHQHPATDLHDEKFTGAVWALAIPKPIIELASEIQKWRDKYGTADSSAMSPYTSESFGGYSYSKGGSGSSNSATSTSWQGAFRNQLNRWRKL